ncbi:MAG: hypothetical protein K9N06_08415 [Candidatus Cloacimonetes bacterium]|nr:hypothetical protein [Candidatus Cloacimonadota bacterium]
MLMNQTRDGLGTQAGWFIKFGRTLIIFEMICQARYPELPALGYKSRPGMVWERWLGDTIDKQYFHILHID